MSKLTAFVDSVLQQPFPKPGASFSVTLKKDLGETSFRFTRPNDSDSLLEHVSSPHQALNGALMGGPC